MVSRCLLEQLKVRAHSKGPLFDGVPMDVGVLRRWRAQCAASWRVRSSSGGRSCCRAPSSPAASGWAPCGRATTWPSGRTWPSPCPCSSRSRWPASPSAAPTSAASSTVPTASSSSAGTRQVSESFFSRLLGRRGDTVAVVSRRARSSRSSAATPTCTRSVASRGSLTSAPIS